MIIVPKTSQNSSQQLTSTVESPAEEKIPAQTILKNVHRNNASN
jgi:hypothetical protein